MSRRNSMPRQVLAMSGGTPHKASKINSRE